MTSDLVQLMMMSDTAVTAVVGALAVVVAGSIAAIPPSLVALASLRQSRENAKQAKEAAAASAETAKLAIQKTDSLTEKVVEVHTLTNGNLSKVTSALEVANEKILGMQKQLTYVIEHSGDTLKAITSDADQKAADKV